MSAGDLTGKYQKLATEYAKVFSGNVKADIEGDTLYSRDAMSSPLPSAFTLCVHLQLKAQVSVLKKAVIDEQSKNKALEVRVLGFVM